MSSVNTTDPEQQPALDLDCAALLQAEIGFWQEMIATCPASEPVESLERMRQALALAQSKLAMLKRAAGVPAVPVCRNH